MSSSATTGVTGGMPERGSLRAGKRIVLASLGSFGDLHPYIALALGLLERGHCPLIATSRLYRDKVEGAGIEFHPIRPETPSVEEAPEVMRRGMDPRTGSAFVIRDWVMPAVREQYEDLMEAARGADFLTSHGITYAAPLVAEKLDLPWAGTALQPMMFLSAYDPPVPPTLTSPGPARFLPAGVLARVFRQVKRGLDRWAEPVHRLRRELGLPPVANPIFEGQFSPHVNLALFSAVLGPPQPDWPPRTVVTGFPFYDRSSHDAGLPVELREFLDAGPPPIVFTLGSAAVAIGGDFYTESIKAAALLGRRAVLLIGRKEWNRLPRPLPEGMMALDYAPHGELFPRAAAVVHHGGIGTTGQTLRAGRPMLVLPFAHDQPDNGYRAARLGVARVVPRRRYNAARAAAELRRLLDDPAYAIRAEEIGRRVFAEDGVAAACDAIERCLGVTVGTPAPG